MKYELRYIPGKSVSGIDFPDSWYMLLSYEKCRELGWVSGDVFLGWPTVDVSVEDALFFNLSQDRYKFIKIEE